MTGHVLAIDIGTSSTKALAVTTDGRVQASHAVAVPLHTPAPGQVEQDPDDVVRAVAEAAGRVAADVDGDCLATVFSAHMHGVIAVGADGAPLTRCWTWADQRALPQAAALHADGVAAGLHARTGTPVHAMAPLAKLQWLRANQPETFAAARRFVSIKEYVFAAMCGEQVIDHSVASCTGMFDLSALQWDAEALSLAGVEADRLSTPAPTTHIARPLPGSGLPDAPVVVGATDGVLANLGVGAVQPGILAVTLGTSGAARAALPSPAADPNGRLFCYALADREWIVGGAIQSAGLVVRWLAELLGAGEPGAPVEASFDELVGRAAEVPAGADGLICLPLLAGERFAAWRPDSSGMFAGLSGRHDSRHMARAVLEGILGCMHTVVRAVEEFTQPADEVRFGGGFAASPFVRQMLADVLDRRVTMPASEQSSGLGAARLALRALGDTTDWTDDLAHSHEPQPEAAAVYRELVELQARMYRDSEDLMGELARWRGAP